METLIPNPTLAYGDKFRKDRPEYKNIAEYIDKQKTIFDPEEEDIACFCGD
jgi:hypothetical protein